MACRDAENPSTEFGFPDTMARPSQETGKQPTDSACPDSTAMATQIQPGFLTLRGLNINMGNLTVGETKFLEMNIHDEQLYMDREFKGRPFRHAARNLRGLLLHQTGKTVEAMKEWKQTVEEDPSNLNALQDLLTIYKKTKNRKQTEYYKNLLKQVKEGCKGREETRLYARCQAEQAYARFRDLRKQFADREAVSQRQVVEFEKALTIGKAFVNPIEQREWNLYAGESYSRLARARFQQGKYDKYKECIKMAYGYLTKALNLSSQNVHKAHVWCAIGSTFTQSKKKDILHSIIPDLPGVQENGILEKLKNPDLCYKMAMYLNPENSAWYLVRLGNFHMENNELDEAIKFLSRSITDADAQETDNLLQKTYIMARNSRARAYVKKAKQAQKGGKVNLLEDALEDVEKVKDIDRHPGILTQLGEINFMLAKEKTNTEAREELLDKALIYFNKSSDYQDGKSMAGNHLKLARCLKFKEDYKSAIASYKLTFELVQKSDDSFKWKVANELLQTMLYLYSREGHPENMCRDIAYWLERIYKASLENSKDSLNKLVHYLCEANYYEDLALVLEVMVEFGTHFSVVMIDKFLSSLHMNYPVRDLNTKAKLSKIKLALHKLSQTKVPKETTMKPSEGQSNKTRYLLPPDEARNDGFDYDFYVINDDSDVDLVEWVTHLLLPGLECPFYALKGHYHERDASLGQLDSATRACAMKSSACILVVVSERYERNTKCNTLANMACQFSDNLQRIVVLHQGPAKVPTYLNHYRYFDFFAQLNIHDLAGYIIQDETT